MRKNIVVTVAALVLGTAAIAGGIYWSNHQSLQSSIRLLKQAVTKDFHDPESARFRSLRLHSLEGSVRERIGMIDASFLRKSTPTEVLSSFFYDTELLVLCGEVNAKNGFGAYVGYKHFYVRGGKDPISFLDTRDRDDTARRLCEAERKLVVLSEDE